MVAMLLLWGCFLGFVIVHERSLIFGDDPVAALGPGCIGCRPSGTTGKGKSWRMSLGCAHSYAPLLTLWLVGTFVPLLIQQSWCRHSCLCSRTHLAISRPAILAGMILFKGFTTPAKGEHAKSIMSVVMRECVNPLFPHLSH
jgi:hypothetical protein